MIIGPRPGTPRPSDGDLVRVVDRDDQALGFGLWNQRSQIAVRLLTQARIHDQPPPGVEFWQRRLQDAIALRRDVLKLEENTNAYRLIHAEGDGITGLVVDRYDDVLSAEVFSLGIYQRIGPILDLLEPLVGTKHRRVHVDDHIAEAEDFSGAPLASSGLGPRATIQENQVRFRVHFAEGHKTGFFCDQRDNRKAILPFCAGKSVLDVCCYTGGFAVYAATRGQPLDVTGVDLDERAIDLARENANLNQVRVQWVHADAFGYMRQMNANSRSFGAVVLDPPKLISTREEISAGKRKYFDLNVLAMNLVEPGGLLLTCSCSGLLPRDEFLALLGAAAGKAGRTAQVLATTGASADHPIRLDALEGGYLKAVWLRMGERIPRVDGPRLTT